MHQPPPDHILDLAIRATIDVMRLRDRARGLQRFDELSPGLQRVWRKDAMDIVRAVEFVLRNQKLPLQLVS